MTDSPKPVVLAPDILLRALHYPEEYRVLLLWRDGLILPVVTRPILLQYLKLFRKAGIEERTLKKWILWLTSKEKARYLEEVEGEGGIQESLVEAARAGEAELITNLRMPNTLQDSGVLLMSPKDLSAFMKSN